MFEIDLRSRDPIYQQLVDKMKQLIVNQILMPDEKLPSVRQLAQDLTINPNTIQKAYRELESEGFIYSVKGRGSFVMPMVNSDNEDKITHIKQEISTRVKEVLFLGVTENELKGWINKMIDDWKGDEDL